MRRLSDDEISRLETALTRNEVATSEMEAGERATMVRALIAEIREHRRVDRFMVNQRTTRTRRGRR